MNLRGNSKFVKFMEWRTFFLAKSKINLLWHKFIFLLSCRPKLRLKLIADKKACF